MMCRQIMIWAAAAFLTSAAVKTTAAQALTRAAETVRPATATRWYPDTPDGLKSQLQAVFDAESAGGAAKAD
jgi:hypothetical protein